MSDKIQMELVMAAKGAGSDEISRVVMARYGLLPRKKDGLARMHVLLLEFYERKKSSLRQKRPEDALITVDEMAVFSGVKRQTVYDYLGRWLKFQLIKKTSLIKDGRVLIGYELNGPNLEAAFKRAEGQIINELNLSMELIKELQNEIKKEKISKTSREKGTEDEVIEVQEVIEPEKN